MPRKSTPPVPATIPTPDEFWKWAMKVPVSTRDGGYGPIKPWGTQRILVDRILGGALEGKRQNLVTKAGQIGSTMVGQLLGAYWMLHFEGTQGAFVANTDEVRDFCRDNIQQMVQAAPHPVPIRLNNKGVLALENGSRLLFHTAGPRSGRQLSVGRGFNWAWGTEMALWGNPAALTIMRTRASETHPLRLYTYETTARGNNWWRDVWDEAEDATDIQRIELLWWQREDNTLDPTSEAFRRYWNTGFLKGREKRWARELDRRYGVTLRPEQYAWHRWYVAEKAGGDDRLSDQEMPTLIEDAFEATGISFLPYESVRRVKRTVNAAPTPERYRYEFGTFIEETQIKPTITEYETLTVWEEPQLLDAYVVAAVPSYSANADCADYVCSVWHASRDELVQVVEFADQECGMQPFSWVCAHLVGAYAAQKRSFILQIAGMGGGVLEELKRLRDSGWGMSTTAPGDLRQIAGGIRHYLWRRPDTMTGTVALQHKTSPELNIILMNRLRDQINAGRVIIRSDRLLRELEKIRQDGEEFKAEGKEPADHRVHAACLAVESWATQLVPIFRKVQGDSRASTVTGKMVQEFFINLRQPKKAMVGGRR